MLLAIDIGNSSTKFGIFDSATLIDRFSIPTVTDYTLEELSFDRLLRPGGRFLAIDTVTVASVVPEMNEMLGNAVRKNLNVEARFVDHTWDFGFRINYQPPETAGVDRLVNAYAAARNYGLPVIACSFGTATTFDVVTDANEYVGGAIAPGLRLLASALHQNTSKLPLVEIAEPAGPIGSSTVDSIKSGVFYGYIGMVEGIIRRISDDLNIKPTVVATGGFAGTIAPRIASIDKTFETLTLDGLRMLSQPGIAHADAP